MEGKEVRKTRRRTPMQDLSNCRRSENIGTPSICAISNGKGEDEEELLLTRRLLYIRSHLSTITQQVDELVSRALESNCSNTGRKQLESFINFLDGIHSSLKPWIPKLMEAITCSPRETGNFSELSMSSVEESGSSPCRQMGMGSLISPSPLVCWKGNSKVEHGKQLFLLTPLPMTKTARRGSHFVSESNNETPQAVPAAEVSTLPLLGNDVEHNLLQVASISRTPSQQRDASTILPKSTSKCCSTASTLVPARGHSVLLRTPCLHGSRAESGVMHDLKLRKSTPFPVRIHSSTSESSSNESSGTLCMKYPELLGIRDAFIPTTVTRKDESSPEWSFSPLKSSLLLEGTSLPVDYVDPPLPTAIPIINEQANPSLELGHKASNHIFPELRAQIESTPLWKEAGSMMKTGKRPGESTLKKELWTKFEAASFRGLHLNVSTVQRTARKGFLDMLDEVSEESPPGNF